MELQLKKMVFFIGATNRPDIIDPALLRPGRLDSLIYIGLPDFDARIGIIKACLRKSPVDPEVDFEYLADRTEGFSGADLAGVCKAAAKVAIRQSIASDRRKFEMKEQKRKEAEEKGEVYVEEEEKGEDEIPFLTKHMILSSLAQAKRSVTKQDLERYMKYKRDMERRLGMEEGGGEINMGPVIGLDSERRGQQNTGQSTGTSNNANNNTNNRPTANTSAPIITQPTTSAPRAFDDAAAGADDDDIYE